MMTNTRNPALELQEVLFEDYHVLPCNLREFLDRSDVSEEDKKRAKELAQKIIELGIKDDKNLYLAYKYSNLLDEPEAIIARMRKSIYTKDEEPHYDLLQTALKWGDDNDIQTAISIYHKARPNEFKKENIDALLDSPDCDQITKITGPIRTALEKYRAEFGFKEGYRVDDYNAAMEIKKREYDLAIGIQTGCSALTNVLEMIGQPTRYIRHSKKWNNRKPHWMAIGKEKERVKKAKKIIVCENDAVSGKTLQAVQPLIEKLQPETIDICFSGYSDEDSIATAQNLGFYTNVFSTVTIGYNHFLENIKAVQTATTRLGY